MKHDGIKFNTKSNIPAIYIVYYIKGKKRNRRAIKHIRKEKNRGVSYLRGATEAMACGDKGVWFACEKHEGEEKGAWE